MCVNYCTLHCALHCAYRNPGRHAVLDSATTDTALFQTRIYGACPARNSLLGNIPELKLHRVLLLARGRWCNTRVPGIAPEPSGEPHALCRGSPLPLPALHPSFLHFFFPLNQYKHHHSRQQMSWDQSAPSRPTRVWSRRETPGGDESTIAY